MNMYFRGYQLGEQRQAYTQQRYTSRRVSVYSDVTRQYKNSMMWCFMFGPCGGYI
jgi:hypothetical protein